MSDTPLKAPFPAIGGKSRVADLVWSRFGDPRNYIEPFAFSAAVLLRRPTEPKIETINDVNCYVANFWRAVQLHPDAVANYADWPVNEADLHARHRWLVLSEEANDSLRRVREEPDYYDPQIAGWWCWGQCCWIGAGWCSNYGQLADGTPKQQAPDTSGVSDGRGIHAKRVALGGSRAVLARGGERGQGQGVNRQLSQQVPLLRGDAGAAGTGVNSSGGRPQLADEFSRGRGVNANDALTACETRRQWVTAWMRRLADRLRSVRVCCGDWQRVCGSRSVTTKIGLTGVFLDPPYKTSLNGTKSRDGNLYGSDKAGENADAVVERVNAWCVEWGDNPQMRIAVCGLEGEHANLEALGWRKVAWKSHGGYGNRNPANDNKTKERIWFSPACVTPTELEPPLFGADL